MQLENKKEEKSGKILKNPKILFSFFNGSQKSTNLMLSDGDLLIIQRGRLLTSALMNKDVCVLYRYDTNSESLHLILSPIRLAESWVTIEF